MEYFLIYHSNIPDDLRPLPKNIRQRICYAIENRLLINPLKFGEPLRRSLHGYRKLRVGDYRVIYKIEQNNIHIFKIGHRKEVYE